MNDDESRPNLWILPICLVNLATVVLHLALYASNTQVEPISRCALLYYLPWPFHGQMVEPMLTVAIVLTALTFLKIRAGAVLLLIFFLFSRVFALLYIFGLGIPGMAVHLLWLILTIMAVRGVFIANRVPTIELKKKGAD